MIMFKKIKWKNFLSTGNYITELDLNKVNNTLIIGENGAGKSTVLDALSFVLFGKPFRKINKPQLVNSITKKNMLVEVEFDIGRNQYKIIRGVKPNIFEVYHNNDLLNQSAVSRDYQEILEKQILKVNHKSFCQVVVLGSATFQPFMQLGANQRREIIENLLDLQIFTTMNSLLKDKTLNNSDKLKQILTEKRVLENNIELIKDHIDEFKSNTDKLIFEKESIIDETNERINKQQSERTKLEKLIEIDKSKLKDENAIQRKLKKLDSLKHKIEANLALIDKDIEFFNKHDNCPTCKQAIETEFKAVTIKNKEKEAFSIKDGLEKLAEEYNNTNKRLEEILLVNSAIADNKLKVNNIVSSISHLSDYISNLRKEIEKLKKTSVDKSTDKIPQLKKELKNIDKLYTELSEEKNVLSAAGVLLKDGGIKSKIIKQYIPIMNKLINKYLASMEFMAHFELDENFNETIKSRHRDIFSYSSFSEGEKMRINLAILFAWRSIAKMRNSINTNLLIMDEVFDSSLDSNGTEEFLKIIKNLTIDTNTFIISHKTDQLIDKFDKVIRFEKYRNFSRNVNE